MRGRGGSSAHQGIAERKSNNGSDGNDTKGLKARGSRLWRLHRHTRRRDKVVAPFCAAHHSIASFSTLCTCHINKMSHAIPANVSPRRAHA